MLRCGNRHSASSVGSAERWEWHVQSGWANEKWRQIPKVHSTCLTSVHLPPWDTVPSTHVATSTMGCGASTASAPPSGTRVHRQPSVLKFIPDQVGALSDVLPCAVHKPRRHFHTFRTPRHAHARSPCRSLQALTSSKTHSDAVDLKALSWCVVRLPACATPPLQGTFPAWATDPWHRLY